jgi:hypothetical protein
MVLVPVGKKHKGPFFGALRLDGVPWHAQEESSSAVG